MTTRLAELQPSLGRQVVALAPRLAVAARRVCTAVQSAGPVQAEAQTRSPIWGSVATSTEPSDAYHRLIDTCRATVDEASSREPNAVLVGAYSEAAGEDGAALEMFEGFIQSAGAVDPPHLPSWWSDEHLAALIKLADQRGAWCIRKAPSKRDLIKTWGLASVEAMVADGQAIIKAGCNMDTVKEKWGEEATAALSKIPRGNGFGGMGGMGSMGGIGGMGGMGGAAGGLDMEALQEMLKGMGVGGDGGEGGMDAAGMDDMLKGMDGEGAGDSDMDDMMKSTGGDELLEAEEEAEVDEAESADAPPVSVATSVPVSDGSKSA